MRGHLEDGAAEPGDVERGNAEKDHPHVRHRGVGDHALEIGLAPGEDAAIDQRNESQRRQPVLHCQHGAGQCFAGTNQAVAAHLEQHAGEQNGDRARRFDVSQRQPAMQREDRHLDTEADEQAAENQQLRTHRQSAPAFGHVGHGEAVPRGSIVEQEQRNKHEDRAAERIEHEIQGSTVTVGAPHAINQEKQGDQRQFPEDIEQRPVARHENAEHGGLKHQQQPEVEFGAGPH